MYMQADEASRPRASLAVFGPVGLYRLETEHLRTCLHFVSKSTLLLLASKVNTISVLIFFFSFADHFGLFVVNIKQHLTLRKS